MANLEEELKASQASVLALENDLAACRQELEATEEALQEALTEKDAIQAEKMALWNQMIEITTERDSLVQKLAVMTENLEALSKRLKIEEEARRSAESEISTLNAKITSMLAEHRMEVTELKGIQDAMLREMNALKKAKEQMEMELKAKIAALETMLADARAKSSVVSKEAIITAGVVQSELERRAAVESQLTLLYEAKDSEIEGLRASLAQLKLDHEAAMSDLLAKHRLEIAEHEGIQAEMLKEILELKTKLDDAKEEIARLEMELASEKQGRAQDAQEYKSMRLELECAFVSVLTRATAAVATIRARITLQSLAKATKASARSIARSVTPISSPEPRDISPEKPAYGTGKTHVTLSERPIAGWKRGQRAVRAPRAPRVMQRELSKCIQKYNGHSDWVLKMGLSQDGSRLFTASQDTDVRLFDVATGKCLRTSTAHTMSVLAVVLCEENNTMFTASLDGSVKQWDMATGELLLSGMCHAKGILTLTVVDPTSFVTGSRDDTAILWHIKDKKDVSSDSDEPDDPFGVFGTLGEKKGDQGSSGKVLKKAVTFEGHSRWVMATCTQGSKLFTGSPDTTVRRWDLATGFEEYVYTGHTQEVTSLAVEGFHLYTGSREGTARKISIATGETLFVFSAHLSVVRDIFLCKERLYTASADGTAKCWDTETGKVIFQLTGQGAAVTTVSVHGDMLFTGSSDGLVRQFLMEEDGHGVSSEILTPNTAAKMKAQDPFAAFDVNTTSSSVGQEGKFGALVEDV